MLAEVPTIAIETVWLAVNSSIIQDEVKIINNQQKSLYFIEWYRYWHIELVWFQSVQTLTSLPSSVQTAKRPIRTQLSFTSTLNVLISSPEKLRCSKCTDHRVTFSSYHLLIFFFREVESAL